MIKAVIFDMFETLVTLFTGRTYFSEHIAADLNQPIEVFRKCWHETEKNRTLGKYSMEEGLAITLKNLGAYSPENVQLICRISQAPSMRTFLTQSPGKISSIL